jgi:hypothetical protein
MIDEQVVQRLAEELGPRLGVRFKGGRKRGGTTSKAFKSTLALVLLLLPLPP